MFQVMTDQGQVIAFVDVPLFIKVSASGAFVACPEEEAQGIAVDSTPYHLYGREQAEGMTEEVFVDEMKGGSVVFQTSKELTELQEYVVESKYEDIISDLDI